MAHGTIVYPHHFSYFSLDELVPTGQKSKTINEALRKELLRIRREKVTEKLVLLKSRGPKVSQKEIVKLLKQDRSRKT